MQTICLHLVPELRIPEDVLPLQHARFNLYCLAREETLSPFYKISFFF